MNSPAKRQIAALVTFLVVAHLIVNLLHGNAHTKLGVGLASWQQVYVIVVILLAPLVALVLSWTRFARLGVWLLLVSMLGSLIFGAVYHYVIISNDHVAHLPPGEAQGLFRTTALLLVLTEAVGVIVGAIGVRKILDR